ncbi:MAG TPA: PilZ domain-containing protein [Myxococcota bacterium]|nr:PilZ domain-containing protein [Myxococcota bacterium]HRY92713.1 PilZ domain-containing protein [Myxococcota bacterium]HSA24653.1 PilZ domain-containing protein [Myxococcota bacterium]
MSRRLEERRVRPRVPLASDVMVTRGGEQFTCAARDLSSTGLGMECPQAGQRGELIHVELTLDGSAERLVLQGVQVRRVGAGAGYLWGVHFRAPEPRSTALLMAHVRREIVKSHEAGSWLDGA